ncbi:hypothetical protein [Paenibacillus sp. TC-CSREp1]|uniref:hypothetical protein n=1 Tax=Paenibacillus sp. TC-CSREp1 TaxID=3410089 RepID=UPI003CF6A08D
MSNRKLTKYPVIAEDGTEYRVTIVEDRGDTSVLIYATWRGITWPWSIFAVKVTRYMYHSYEDIVRAVFRERDRRRKVAEEESAAIDAFQAWDGRL